MNGEATYYALSMERFVGTPFNKYIVQQKWIDYSANYGTIVFELLFPLLIWVKKMRKPLLVAGIIFHLCIYIFMMIYGFEIVFILIYGLFLPDKKLADFYLAFARLILPGNAGKLRDESLTKLPKW
jgi:hypothetical protein